MNLLTVTRRMRTYPLHMVARRSKWPEARAIVYVPKLRSFVVKEGGGIYSLLMTYLQMTGSLYEDWIWRHRNTVALERCL